MTRGAAFPSLGRSLPLTNALWDLKPGGTTRADRRQRHAGRRQAGRDGAVDRAAVRRREGPRRRRLPARARRPRRRRPRPRSSSPRPRPTGSLEKAAAAAKRKPEVATSFARAAGVVPGIGSSQEVKDAAFALSEDKRLADTVFVVVGRRLRHRAARQDRPDRRGDRAEDGRDAQEAARAARQNGRLHPLPRRSSRRRPRSRSTRSASSDIPAV